MEAQHPTLMEVRSVTPGWDSPSASALKAGLVVVHMRDLPCTCLGDSQPICSWLSL